MTKKLSSHAQAAKEIRTFLKTQGLKARVKARSFSMGNSVDVFFVDQDPAKVAEIKEELRKWQYGSFNGMIDMYEYDNNHDDRTQVKYVCIEENYSDELLDKAWLWYRALNPNDALPESRKNISWAEDYRFIEPGETCGRVYHGHAILRAIVKSPAFRNGYKPRMRAA